LIVFIVADKTRSAFLVFDVVSKIDFDGVGFFFLIYLSEVTLQLARQKGDFILIVLSLYTELVVFFLVELIEKILCGFVDFEIKHSFAELLPFFFELLIVSLNEFSPLGFVVSVSHSLQFCFLLVDSRESQCVC